MSKNWRGILTGIVSGEVFFVSMVFFAMGVSFWNAGVTPSAPWFPIIVLGVLFYAVYKIDQKWDIGLKVPSDLPMKPVIGFAVMSMIASHALLVLEGAMHGITRSFPPSPEGVTPLFAFVYWVGITFAMSTASEAGYRGIMQSRLMPLIGVGPAIAIVTFMNLISHRYDGLYERAIGVTAILVAWGYLRHLSGSLTPTIITHISAIFIWDLIMWQWGPWDHSLMGPFDLYVTGIVMLLTFWLSIHYAKQIKAARGI